MNEGSNSFYTETELKQMPFKSLGSNVSISRKASFYSMNSIEIGDKVRIDDFCIISGEVRIGNYVHISAFSALYGGAGIDIGDYSGVSPRTTIFSVTDDFSGESMIGPMVPPECINLEKGRVVLKRYVQLGAHVVVFPGVTAGEGAVVGAASLVNKDLKPYSINVGVPCRFVRKRSDHFLGLKKQHGLP